jgi:hypothetical protein
MQLDTQGIIHLLEQQKAAIESAIAALNGIGKAKPRVSKKRSKATRLLMSKAQRKRWKVLRGTGKKSKS